jgi:hemolysin activation/secretion protein
MVSLLRQCLRIVTACVLVTVFAVPPSLMAEAHVVSPAELQQQTAAASRSRQHNLDTLTVFLSSAAAQKQFKSAGVNNQQVKSAIASLSDQELAKLANRAEKAQADFAAGNLTDHDLLIILIAVVALVLIIVAVHH